MTAPTPAARSTFFQQGLRAAAPFAVYLTLIAATLAYLEVQIEGPHGWAATLPTWRVTDPRLTWIFGGRPVTGYHVGLNLLLLLLFHWPALFTRWGLVQEVRVLSAFTLLAVVWDFLWFVLNPHFGLARYGPDTVWWFTRWWLGVPVDYFVGLTNSVVIRCLPALLRKEPLWRALAEGISLAGLVVALTALIAWAAESVRAA
jgi:hypothetical protein